MLKIYVANLGKYNEGELVGKWPDLPAIERKQTMTTIKNGIIAVLFMITTIVVSAAVTTYASQRDLERNYALLESRYVQLYSHTMRTELADYMTPVEY